MEDFQVINSYLCIRMPKELDHHRAIRIRETADKYIEGQHIEYVVFDFEDTSFMDSSGIGVIMGRYKKVHTLGGKVMAIHVNERVRKILQLSGLHKIVEIIEEER
ncbi:MAG: anti-sigma F factor antagonist [Lachnospiraceae bacterium]|nr:anti-sigma F factor antagonist [Lachnospiraceae bacterium]